MFENEILKHHIQRQIVHTLMFNEYARFTDLCPPRVDTNLFSYHLKLLLKQGYVAKTEQGYTLSHKGMQYVDRISATKMRLRTQPKIITMLFVQSPDGRVLLQKRTKQPYINTWTLPYGKLHIDDLSLMDAATREANEKLGSTPSAINHLGDCYIRVMRESYIESTTLAHLVGVTPASVPLGDNLQWVTPESLPGLRLAPAVQQIIARCNNSTVMFFDEYTLTGE